MTELVPAERRELDLRNPVTDSWTQVVEDVGMLANRIAGTDFVPSSFGGKPAQVAAAILHGRELGLPPLTALAQTHIVNGRPGISAEAMRGLALQAGHDIVIVEQTSGRCVMKGRRQNSEEWTTVTWTMDDARHAGLLSKGPWKSYPRQMLAARCSVELCRLIFADVIHGMQALEELHDLIDPDDQAPEPAPTVTQVRRKPRTPKPQPSPAAAPNDEAVASPDAAGATSSPPERRRPTLPSPDVEEATAGPSVEEQQAEIRNLAEEKRRLEEPVDAEIVEPAPPAGEKDEHEPAPDMAPPGHQASIIMHFKRLGVDDRAERLYWTGRIIGRDVESTKHLTKDQAVQVMKSLEVLRDRDALEATAKGDD